MRTVIITFAAVVGIVAGSAPAPGLQAPPARTEEKRMPPSAGDELRAGPLLDFASKRFTEGDRENAILVAEATRRLFPDDVRVYSVLGQFYWYEEDRDRSIENFRQVLIRKPDQETARRYWDLLFFVPEAFEVPRTLKTDHLVLRPLRVSDVEMDYAAVMANREHIRGVFGPDDDWPSDQLSLEEDLRALKGKEEGFRRRYGFTYTVTDPEGKRCRGCVYILPCHADAYDAQVYLWVTREAADAGLDEELYAAVRSWIDDRWPFSRVAYPGRDIDWKTWATIDP